MKNRYLRIVSALLLLCMVSCALLTSCSPAYDEYHTDEHMSASGIVGGKGANAYLFLLEDESAVMDICRRNGKLIQRIELGTTGDYYTSLDFDYAFFNTVFQDMNFDGYLDLYIPCSVTTANLEGMAWLWDTAKKEFVLSKELSALYELTVVSKDKLIKSIDYLHPEGPYCTEYKWEGEKLTKVNEYIVTPGE